MESKQRHARSRSFTGGSAGGVLASFLRSTAVSFSSSSTTFASHGGGHGNGKTAATSFNHRNAFSGPMVSIVPPEARGAGRRTKGGSGSGSGYRTPEPSSPKVSCMGQIKKSKSKRAARKVNPRACGKDGGACPLPPKPPVGAPGRGCRPKSSSLVKRMFSRRSRSRSLSKSGSDGFKTGKGSTAVAAAPPPAAGLGQMKRFTSGRAAFQDFDWREEAERTGSDVDNDVDYEVDDGFVAHSAPLVLGGGVVASEPRKEVNLWRRRPMSPPTPLQLP